eukprot:scaffold66453_cov66-Phaeocystis_antarctica.AAC.1
MVLSSPLCAERFVEDAKMRCRYKVFELFESVRECECCVHERAVVTWRDHAAGHALIWVALIDGLS